MITGDERALEAATNGTGVHAAPFPSSKQERGICCWYSQIDIQKDGSVRKYMGSTAGGDEGGNAIPCYEQIYALAGPTQTYRLTGSWGIRTDIDDTISFLNRFYKDHGHTEAITHTLTPSPLIQKLDHLGLTKPRRTGTQSATTHPHI